MSFTFAIPSMQRIAKVPNFTPETAADEFATAADATSLIFTQGITPWTVTYLVYHFGSSAVQSGYISDNGKSSFETQVQGTGTLKFYWKTSSELNHDYLKVYVDGNTVANASISGTTDWVLYRIMFSGSEEIFHTIKWSYEKDSSGIAGNDCGYVDHIQWTNTTTSITVTSPNYLSNWPKERSRNILWDWDGYIGNVKIELYRLSSLVSTITISTFNDGNYTWTLPSTLTTSTTYQIKIIDANNSLVYDLSDNFEVSIKNELTAGDPTDDGDVKEGNSMIVRWTSVGTSIEYVHLELYLGSTKVWNIARDEINDGYYYISSLPSNISANSGYKIKIIDADDSSVYDYSDSFEIKPEFDIFTIIQYVLPAVFALAIIGSIAAAAQKKKLTAKAGKNLSPADKRAASALKSKTMPLTGQKTRLTPAGEKSALKNELLKQKIKQRMSKPIGAAGSVDVNREKLERIAKSFLNAKK